MSDFKSTVAERWKKYVHRRQDHQCWPWTGSKAVRGGYGQLNDRKKLLKAHRLAWELHFGPIPEELLVRHMCHNPECCNPTHLLLGTDKDNSQDAVRAKRNVLPPLRKGEECYQTPFTKEDIIKIRSSPLTGVELAKLHNVSRSAISQIRKRKVWRHV